ncbi:MAG: MaoC family dehydratase [Syntrophomonadaceae bacterium]|nr:MaoC family dehydratase [Syntrophomonadaceae bacterium]
MPEYVSLESFKKMVGQDNGTTEWITIDQDRINKFADVTEDWQWIHVDVEKAKDGPFGKTIGHGFLTLSLLSTFSYQAKYTPEGCKMSVNYGLNKVRFLSPVPVGSRVRSHMVISSLEEKGPNALLMTITHTVEIEGQDKPACIADALGLMYF